MIQSNTNQYILVLKQFITNLNIRIAKLLPETKQMYGLNNCRLSKTKELRMCACCGKPLNKGTLCVSSTRKTKNDACGASKVQIRICCNCIEKLINEAEIQDTRERILMNKNKNYKEPYYDIKL